MNVQFRKVLNTRMSPDYMLTSVIDSFLSSHYSCVEVRSNVDLLPGYAFKSTWFSDIGMPLLRNINVKPQRIDWSEKALLKQELVNDYRRFELEEGDIVFSMDGSVSNEGVKIAIIKKEDLPCYLLQRVCRLKTTSKLSSKYLFWMLQTNRFIEYIVGSNRSIAISHISAQQILGYKIPLPPLSVQEEIIEFINGNRQQLSDNRLADILSRVLELFGEKTQFNLELKKCVDYIEMLRGGILQEAVSGKLVPQEPNDEPASELLIRIKSEKEKLAQKTKNKKDQSFSSITEEKKPYKLPNTWEWVRLGEIGIVNMGQSPEGKTYNSGGIGTPLINGPVEFSKGSFGFTVMSKWTTLPTKLCRKGAILICVRGSTTGRTNIAGFDACIGRGVASIQPYILQKYVHYYLLHSEETIFNLGSGTTFPNITLDELNELIFPLPPLTEQKRIVEKVDQLMAICDELERKVKENQNNSELLMEAVLKEAFAS